MLISFFSINEIQANAILDMRLRSLRKLEEIELKKELDDLQNELNEIKKLFKSEISVPFIDFFFRFFLQSKKC